MNPITVRRLPSTVRAATVALTIAVLSAGATGPAVAAAPIQDTPTAAEAGGRFVAPGSLSIGPGMLAELAADPGLATSLAAQALDDLLPDGVRTAAAAVEPTAPATRPATKPASTAAPTRDHRGRNHVWSPTFGLDREVSWFSCSRSETPGYSIYRWGCAGHNNVYLFAHAGGPFHRLHDLYVRGRLRKGMAVTYADAGGHIHRFTVAWWKVVLPTAGEFAYAPQPRPSMTLQTCVGPHDRYRLVVRLYQND